MGNAKYLSHIWVLPWRSVKTQGRLSVPMSRPESGRHVRRSPWLSKLRVLNKADVISIFIRSISIHIMNVLNSSKLIL